MSRSDTKSKFLAFLAVFALFSAVIFAGGCGGSSSSSNEDEHYCEEELAMQKWDRKQAELPDETVEKDILSTAKALTGEIIPDETQSNSEQGKIEGVDYKSYVKTVTENEDTKPAISDGDPYTTKEYELKVTVLSGTETIPDNFLANSEGKLAGTNVLVIDGSVKKIGANAFKGAPDLQIVIIRGAPEIGASAFENCAKLWYAGVACHFESLDEMKAAIDELKDTKIKLGGSAFANCATTSVYEGADTDNSLYFDCGVASAPSDEDCENAFKNTKKIIAVAGFREAKSFDVPTNGGVGYAEPYAKYKSWGADLPDNATIPQISIPGSHDSATYKCEHLPIDGFARTQGLSLSGQYKQGVRFFDLRVIHDDNGIYEQWMRERMLTMSHLPKPTDRSFMLIAHGPTICPRLDERGKKVALTLHDAIKEIADEVYRSSDFAIIQIIHQNEEDDVCDDYLKGDRDDYYLGDAAIQEELAKWKETKGDYKAVAVQHNPDLKVKDLRGKILFIHNVPNNCYPSGNIPVTGCWGDALEMGGTEDIFYVKKIYGKYDPSKEKDWEKWPKANEVLLQNRFKASPNDKIKSVEDMFKDYLDDLKNDSRLWGFNYTSAYTGGIPNYPKVAAGVNERAARLIDNFLNGTTGFVIMDYAGVPTATRPLIAGKYKVNGDKLLEAVIKHNFKK